MTEYGISKHQTRSSSFQDWHLSRTFQLATGQTTHLQLQSAPNSASPQTIVIHHQPDPTTTTHFAEGSTPSSILISSYRIPLPYLPLSYIALPLESQLGAA